MNKKRIIGLVTIILAVLLIMTACGSSQIVGTWRVVEAEETIGVGTTFQFRRNGTFLFNGQEGFFEPHTWETDGSNITLGMAGSTLMSGTYSVSGRTLTILFSNGELFFRAERN